MEKNITKGIALNDDILNDVTGGSSNNKEGASYKCPICKNSVTYTRNIRFEGANITLYKCANCNREFSLNQINGVEGLMENYTGKGEIGFGM
ncbi:MAG: hypothetical protein K6E98_08070 [Lachnospiraceae bacterium]|nr:hypothetical protein [Lachnospiraceae bacterium]